jgi:Flp pilus assembly protein TadG
MTRPRFDTSNEQGFALIYMAVFLTTLLLFVGVAVDSGRAYIVQAQLSKAVDGAALGAARMLNSGNPRQEAAQIFNANFPVGYMGTTSVTNPTTDPGFFSIQTVNETGVNIVTVTASAVMPTSFMRLGSTDEVTVTATGEAQRRMVDLSLVIDVSSSIGWRWPYVRDGARAFVNAFDQANDRMALIFFGNGAEVIDQMRPGRGFDKADIINDIPQNLPNGSTAMVQGLFRGWDELRTVSNGQQSSLRIIVLFTDGASNSVPGVYALAPGVSRGLRTWDFPNNGADPDNQTHATPRVDGLYDTTRYNTGGSPAVSWIPTAGTCNPPGMWCSTQTPPGVPWLTQNAYIANPRSGGMPNNFPLMTGGLTVNGTPQNVKRPLTGATGPGGAYPAKITNINAAARNLVEIIANEARSDATGDYPIRIYTIGMGELVTYLLGPIQEPSSEILMRMSNDKRSPDFNNAQLEGKFFYAATPEDVGPAFQGIQNQIIRLTK